MQHKVYLIKLAKKQLNIPQISGSGALTSLEYFLIHTCKEIKKKMFSIFLAQTKKGEKANPIYDNKYQPLTTNDFHHIRQDKMKDN